MSSKYLNPFYSLKLVSLDNHLLELIDLYKNNKFPKVLLLSGKKGSGKFTLVNHFLNWIFSEEEQKTKYDLSKKQINKNSKFYNSILNSTSQEVIFIQAEETKNIKIEDIRNLKNTISNTSLVNKPRFIVIDEVEFFNDNSANALLKTLEEPSINNFFILINNQQNEVLQTIASRCLNKNIFLSNTQKKEIKEYLITNNQIENIICNQIFLTPGSFLRFNDLCNKYKISNDDILNNKITLLLNGFRKDKDKTIIQLIYHFIDTYFINQINEDVTKSDLLVSIKSNIINDINNLTKYNLNITSVLSSINSKLLNV